MSGTLRPRRGIQKSTTNRAGNQGARRVVAQARLENLREVSISVRDRHLTVDAGTIREAIHVLDRAGYRFRGGCGPGSLSIAFLDSSALAKLHDRFLQDPSETDVITFFGDETLGLAGEICISAAAAMRFARPEHHSFREELMRYLVHGWLHLAGYDDLQPAHKKVMRRAEERALKLLRQAKQIPAFRWASRGRSSRK